MNKMKYYCAVCGKEVDDTQIKRFTKDGQPLCEDCYQKEIKKQSEASQILEPPSYPIDDLSKLPNRKDYQNICEYCLDCLYAINASDLHLKSLSYPVLRKGGRLFKVSDEIVTNEEIVEFTKKYYLGTEDLNNKIVTVDYSFDYKDVRFRSNFFHDKNGGCLSLRLIKLFSVDFDVLGLPSILKELALKRSGLILVTGPTGSGKSTSLAALLSYINNHTSLHIITLEDPIEYVHPNKGCIISQREIGRDCSSYDQAITEILREDPDILMIGEMRDKRSIEAALRAVETGHIVMSTLHTRGSVSTITRIVETFPSEEQNQIRNQLASCLLAVCSQQLVPSLTPGEVCLASELLINDTPVQAAIRGNKLTMVSSLIQMGKNEGMYSMNDSLQNLLKSGKIAQEDVKKYEI